jgi:SH2 domain
LLHIHSCCVYHAVRDGDTVKHYRIRQLDDGGYFIARRATFTTVGALVEHYTMDADGLCVNLRKPCVQVCGYTRSLIQCLLFFCGTNNVIHNHIMLHT